MQKKLSEKILWFYQLLGFSKVKIDLSKMSLVIFTVFFFFQFFTTF